jgi:hypothetical protein
VKAEAPLPLPSPLPHMERGYVPVVLGQLRVDAPVPTRIAMPAAVAATAASTSVHTLVASGTHRLHTVVRDPESAGIASVR